MGSKVILGSASLAAVMLIGCGSAAAPTAQPSPLPTPSVTVSPSLTLQPSAAPSLESSSPAAEATVPTDWTTYTSERYEYVVDYPSDWIATPATQDWPATGNTYPDDPAIDKWVMPLSGSTWVLMFVSSVPLKAGENAAARMKKLDSDNAQQCDLSGRREMTLDGQTARQEEGMCFGSDYIREVAAVAGGRFYFLYVLSGSPLTETTQATFDHFLGSFKFATQGP